MGLWSMSFPLTWVVHPQQHSQSSSRDGSEPQTGTHTGRNGRRPSPGARVPWQAAAERCGDEHVGQVGWGPGS